MHAAQLRTLRLRDDERTVARLVQDNREGEDYQMGNGNRLRLARDQLRTVTVTDMNYVDGMLLVAGASNEGVCIDLPPHPIPLYRRQPGEFARDFPRLARQV